MPSSGRNNLGDTAKRVAERRILGWLIAALLPFLMPMLLLIGIACIAVALLGASVQGTNGSNGCDPTPLATGANNTQIAYNFLATDPQFGLKPFQAAAIVGNFIHESGGDPIVTQVVNSIGARGIGQWYGVRAQRLLAHQYQGKPWTDIYFQLDFLKEELLGSQRGSLAALKRTTDIDTAAATFEASFEVSGDIASYPRRIGFARSVYQRYANQVPAVNDPQGVAGQKVYVLGDSITLGSTVELIGSFRAAGATTIINGSVSRSILRPGTTDGNKTSGIGALQTGSVQRDLRLSDVLVIELGTNVDGNGSADTYRSAMSRLVESARAINPQLKIYAVNIFSPAVSRRGDYNKALESIGTAAGFTVIDVASKGIDTSGDRIHPTAAGEEAFAQALTAAVTANGASGSGQSCATVPSGSSDLNGPIRVDSSPGKIVPVPGQPGTTVDNRILPNVLALAEKYKLHLGDCAVPGPSPGPHTINGEHPLGLGCDIYPDFNKGGSWDLVDELAAWAEPSQNNPREPFRWVGYNGDYHHGRGNHLHLSWEHAPAAPFTVATWVKVIG